MANNFIDIPKMRMFCHKVLPLVYDDSLSYYEVLCKVVFKLNEVISNIEKLPEYISELISDERLREIMATLLNQLQEQIASANEGTSETATADRVVGELVWLNGYLYRCTKAIDTGDRYIENSNVEKITIEDCLLTAMYAITDTVEGNERNASADRTKGELVWFNNGLYLITDDIAEGNSYTTSNCREVDINELFAIVATKIGDLNDLTTNNKTSIVAAINSLMPPVKYVDTVSDMADSNLHVGDYVITKGYYSVNDGGSGMYVISDTASGYYETVGNLYANLIYDSFLNVKQMGLKGGFADNDASVINKITTFLHNAEYTSNYFTGDFYYGNNLTLYFPRDNYKLNMTIDANRYILEGNGSVFDGDGGVTLTITGLHVTVNHVSFVNCSKAILYNGQNLESGYFNVRDCRFYKTTDDAIEINGLQSYIGTIERCAFLLCNHVLDVNQQSDHFTMRDCWISVKPMLYNYDASILFNGDGELVIDGCLFVPTGYSASNILCSYIKCAGNCTVVNSHFGGEAGSLPIIITDAANDGMVRGIYTIRDCPQTYCQNNGRALVLIKSAFTRITIDNCIGFCDYQKPVRIVPGFAPTDVNYGNIVLTNLRGNTFPKFSHEHGTCYQPGVKYLEAELYPFLTCDKHITKEGLNVMIDGTSIKGFENTFAGSTAYNHYGQIHALIEYRELDTSDQSTYYYKRFEVLNITCFLNNDLMTFVCSDPSHFTITNNTDFYHDTDITIVPTSLASDLVIHEVWADTYSNKDEILAYPDLY